jgi:hypothetical protein
MQDGDAADGDDPNQPVWNATLEVASPLYIDLLYFTGQENSGAVVLEWLTVSEQDNDYFTIEKSKDGRFFSPIGQVKSLGTTTEKQTYNFVDKTPYEGLNYYRLKNTSLSGEVDYSSVINVLFELKTPTTVSFYPNPVTTLLNVEVSSNYDEPSLHLQLFDITGRIVLSQQLDMADTFTHSVAVNHLAKGTYVVKIVGQSYVQSQKITVK